MTSHARPQSRRTRGEGSTVYCLVPPDLPKLHDILSRHFRDEPGVEVLLERRSGERRSGEDRRVGKETPQQRPPIPEEVAEYADRLTFVELRERERAQVPAQRHHFRDQVEHLEGRAARAEAEVADWRDRCLAAEREVEELLRALVGAAHDLRELRSLSPRWFLAVRRAEQAIERQRERRVSEHR